MRASFLWIIVAIEGLCLASSKQVLILLLLILLYYSVEIESRCQFRARSCFFTSLILFD